MTNCNNCGAPKAVRICDYCGTTDEPPALPRAAIEELQARRVAQHDLMRAQHIAWQQQAMRPTERRDLRGVSGLAGGLLGGLLG